MATAKNPKGSARKAPHDPSKKQGTKLSEAEKRGDIRPHFSFQVAPVDPEDEESLYAHEDSEWCQTDMPGRKRVAQPLRAGMHEAFAGRPKPQP